MNTYTKSFIKNVVQNEQSLNHTVFKCLYVRSLLLYRPLFGIGG